MRHATRGLSLLVAATMLAAPSARAQRFGPDLPPAEQAALRNYHLTMAKVSDAAAATRDLEELGKRNPELAAAAKSNGNVKTLSELTDRLNSFPGVQAVLAKHNLTARDYMLTVLSSMYAAVGYMAQQHGNAQAAQIAAGFPTNSDNIQFYAAHRAEIEKLQQASKSSSP